ncbi:MAG: 30S ribosome-binding factor RbfA [Bacilli bacterium]|nr:30S ribosome-binding factor RbfA [Bacilli bacterium]
MNNIRVGRISSEMLRELSTIMLLEARDVTLKHITLTGLEVTNDLSYAKVYYTYMGEESPEDVKKNLEVAEPYLRTMLASKMKDLRKMPELRFYVDESIEYGNNIERILNDIKKDDE